MNTFIDVSEHQGLIDWDKVKAAGIDGVIIRAGYGRGNIDKEFHHNINGAILAGIKNIGIYWFSYAFKEGMGIVEASYCKALLKDYKKNINLPVFFDWEYDVYCGDDTVVCFSDRTFDKFLAEFQKAMSSQDLSKALHHAWGSVMADLAKTEFSLVAIPPFLITLCFYASFLIPLELT